MYRLKFIFPVLSLTNAAGFSWGPYDYSDYNKIFSNTYETLFAMQDSALNSTESLLTVKPREEMPDEAKEILDLIAKVRKDKASLQTFKGMVEAPQELFDMFDKSVCKDRRQCLVSGRDPRRDMVDMAKKARADLEPILAKINATQFQIESLSDFESNGEDGQLKKMKAEEKELREKIQAAKTESLTTPKYILEKIDEATAFLSGKIDETKVIVGNGLSKYRDHMMLRSNTSEGKPDVLGQRLAYLGTGAAALGVGAIGKMAYDRYQASKVQPTPVPEPEVDIEEPAVAPKSLTWLWITLAIVAIAGAALAVFLRGRN